MLPPEYRNGQHITAPDGSFTNFRQSYFEGLVLKQTNEHGPDGTNKIKQFGIKPLLDSPDQKLSPYLRNLRSLGVWGVQNPSRWLNAAENGEDYTVMVGFRPSRWHMGHLTLARELAFHLDHGGKPLFVVSGYEANAPLSQRGAEKKVEELLPYVSHYAKSQQKPDIKVVADTDSIELRKLEDQIGYLFSIKAIQRLYGWDDTTSINKIRIPILLAASFLLPQVLNPDRATVVLTDVNQTTHSELAKVAARRLGIDSPPAYSHRLLLPGLSGTGRMSVKDASSVVFLDEPEADIEKKLRRSVTGGQPTLELQQQLGGDSTGCSFFRSAELLLDAHAERTHSTCRSGALCGACKKQITQVVVKTLQQIGRSRI